MKNLFISLLVTSLALMSCSNVDPTVITAEVIRLTQNTEISAPTLDSLEVANTQTSYLIGTPIAIKSECYKTAITQLELNSCATSRESEAEQQMDVLVKDIEEKYESYPQEKLQSFLLFQSEWKDFSKRECEFRSGHIFIENNYEGGSMAIMNFNECLVNKYQNRLRELQIQLFEMSR